MKKVQNTLWWLSITSLVLALTATTFALIDNEKPRVQVSDKGCCQISWIKQQDQYLVTWKSLNTQDSYTELVEVEYPDDTMTLETELALELAWTLAEFRDICWTNKH